MMYVKLTIAQKLIRYRNSFRNRNDVADFLLKSAWFFRRRGGIGRHAVLRGRWRKLCEFESRRRHHVKDSIVNL